MWDTLHCRMSRHIHMSALCFAYGILFIKHLFSMYCTNASEMCMYVLIGLYGPILQLYCFELV